MRLLVTRNLEQTTRGAMSRARSAAERFRKGVPCETDVDLVSSGKKTLCGAN